MELDLINIFDPNDKLNCDLEYILRKGHVNCDQWANGMIDQLVEEVRKGESIIGIDKTTGNTIRIVSVAKPVCYDNVSNCMLVEMFQVSDNENKISVRCRGIAEKFNPLKETVQVACTRALLEELGIDNILFSHQYKKTVEILESAKYVGLNCAYHLYYCEIEQQSLRCIEDVIPKSSVYSFHEANGPNPKTMYWGWVSYDCRDGIAAQLRCSFATPGCLENDDLRKTIHSMFCCDREIATASEKLSSDFETIRSL